MSIKKQFQKNLLNTVGSVLRRHWGVVIILLLGVLFYGYRLGDLSPGLSCDEASVGYNAYSLLKTGKDEWGAIFPLYFKAFGEYKSPLYIYLTMLPVAVLGMNAVSVRLISVVFALGTLTLGLLFGQKLLGNKRIGLITAVILLFMPWYLQIARTAFDGVVLVPFFALLGFYCFLQTQKKKSRIPIAFASLSFALTFYSNHTGKVVASLTVLICLIMLLFISSERFLKRITDSFSFFGVFTILLTPFIIFTIQNPQESFARWFEVAAPKTIFIPLIITNYLQQFSFSYLFYEGDRYSILHHVMKDGIGQLLLFSLPFLVIGLLVCIKRARFGEKPFQLLVLWLLLYPIPSAITTGVLATRSLWGAPLFALLTAIGVEAVLSWLLSKTHQKAFGIFTLVFFTILGIAALGEFSGFGQEYFIHYPISSFSQSGHYSDWQTGMQDVATVIAHEQEKYDLILLTTTETIQPYIFELFYNQIDPTIVQKRRLQGDSVLGETIMMSNAVEVEKTRLNGGFYNQKVLFVARPEESKTVKNMRIRERILAPRGEEVFIIGEIQG
ncbi:MAG: glycosyltransferase family 39 protein [bacterium]